MRSKLMISTGITVLVSSVALIVIIIRNAR